MAAAPSNVSTLLAKLNGVAKALGPPQQQIVVSPYGSPAAVNSYQEAFYGRNHYLPITIMSLVDDTSNMDIIRRLASFEIVGGLSITRRVITANVHMPEQLPMGAAPPVVKTEWREVVANLLRFSLAAEVNIESLVTVDGLGMWGLKLAQLAAGFSALVAALFCTELAMTAHPHLLDEIKGPDGRIDALRIEASTEADFDVFRRDPTGGGASAAIERARGAIQARADMLLVAKGVVSVLATGPKRDDFQHAGPSSRAMLELGADGMAGAVDRRRYFGDIEIVTFDGVDAIGRGGRPMRNKHIVPTHTRSDPAVLSCLASDKQFNTDMLNVELLEMNVKLDWKTVTARDIFAANRRFDSNGNLSPKHAELARVVSQQARAQQVAIDPLNVDPFIYHVEGDKYAPVHVIGDMPPLALTKKTFKAMVASARAAIGAELAVPDIGHVIGTLSSTSSLATLSTASLDETAPVNEFGSVDPARLFKKPSEASAAAYAATTGGRYTIANVDPASAHGRAIGADAITAAAKFVRDHEQLHDALEKLVNPATHPFFSGDALPEHLRPTDTGSPDYKRRLSLLALGHALYGEDDAHFVQTSGRALDMRPLKTALAAVPELTEAHVATVNSVRAALTPENASRATLDALATADSVSALRADFERHSTSRIAKDKHAPFTDVVEHLRSQLEAGKTEEAVNTVNHLTATLEKPSSATVPRFDKAATKTAWASVHEDAGNARASSPPIVTRLRATDADARKSGLVLKRTDVPRRFRSPMLAKRMNNLSGSNNNPTPEMVIESALLQMPVNAETFETFFDNDIYPPVAHLLERPDATVETSTSYVIASGSDCATIFHHEMVVSIGQNATTRDMLVHATLVVRALIMDVKRIYPLHSSYQHKYVSGYDATFANANAAYERTARQGSIRSYLTCAGSLIGPERTVALKHAYTGRPPTTLGGAGAPVAFIGALYYTFLDSRKKAEMTISSVLMPASPSNRGRPVMSSQDTQRFCVGADVKPTQVSHTFWGPHHAAGNGDIFNGAARVYPDVSASVVHFV